MNQFMLTVYILFTAMMLLSAVKSSHGEDAASPPIVVLITGCSSGIGKAAALAFATSSDHTFIVYATMRNPSKWQLDKEDPLSSRIVIRHMDVVSESSIDTLVDEIIQTHGKIDIVVNNAGYGLAGSLETVTIEEAKDVFEVNVWGVVRLLHKVLPFMRNQRAGHVINISSTSGIRGIPSMDFYTGSKFALEGIMDSLRYSLSLYDVSITNVNAGPVRTSFTDRFGDASVGGLGTRKALNGEALEAYALKAVNSLKDRMGGPRSRLPMKSETLFFKWHCKG